MDLRYRFWRLSIKYFLNLAWINCNTLSGDDMSKKQNFIQPESTLAELGTELMVMKSLQNNSEMLRMLFFTLEIDQDVIRRGGALADGPVAASQQQVLGLEHHG
jgi:hypothetical protein